MIRRDFLRALTAFSTVAATGGGVAVASAAPKLAFDPNAIREHRLLVDKPRPIWAVPVDLEVVRGDTAYFTVVGLGLRSCVVVLPDGRTRPFSLCEAVHNGRLETAIGISGHDTAFYRPGVYHWTGYGESPSPLIGGKFTVLPDGLWNAEEEVIGIARQLHPLGVSRLRDGRYEVGLRARLAGDRPSLYENRLESLIEHTRPVSCSIINGGAGAMVYFKERGLLG